jgi:cell division septation protein DedD
MTSAPPPTTSAKEQQEPIIAFQVGAFLHKENADRLVADLLRRGFYGTISKKNVQGKEFWVVTVEAPPNPFEDFGAELSDAGFPSFPIR